MTKAVAGLLAILAIASGLHAEVVARCGEGYLEEIDGYRVLHVRGTPFEMGYQHGVLLKKECRSILRFLLKEKQNEASVEILGLTLKPEHAIKLIFRIQKGFIPKRYIEEMKGIAKGAGVDVWDVYVANSIPELFHCSGFALTSKITSEDGLLHGRVLDYGVDWRLQEHAVLVIAEPEGLIPFANVTYTGFAGSVTGMNRRGISIGEMGGRGLGKWFGMPMAFLVRKALEEAATLEEAIACFRDTRRTCDYYYVLADGKADDAVGMEASADRFFTLAPGERHDQLPTPVKDAVLLSAGSRYRHLVERVKKVVEGGGKFSTVDAIRLMDAPVAMKSNLHNVLMAPRTGRLWIANASPEKEPAWTQKYFEFNVFDLMDRKGEEER